MKPWRQIVLLHNTEKRGSCLCPIHDKDAELTSITSMATLIFITAGHIYLYRVTKTQNTIVINVTFAFYILGNILGK